MLTCNVDGKWWFLHEWSKWRDGEVKYTNDITQRETERQVQLRDCERCGEREVKELKVKK